MHRSNSLFPGLGAALCLILFGTAAEGPNVWPWIFFGAVLTGGLWWAKRRTAAPPPQPAPEPPISVEQPYEVVQVESVRLPSAVADYDFFFSASIWWRPREQRSHGEDAALSARAKASIIERAEAVTHAEQPGRWDSVRYRLEGVLGAVLPDASLAVVAMASHVTLTLTPADRERLDNLANLRKAQATWDRERQFERDRRHYFATEILHTPGSAVTWWLARHDDEIEHAANLIGPLAQLSAASNDAEVPELFRHLVHTLPASDTADLLGGSSHPATHPASPSWSADPLDDDTDSVLRGAHLLLGDLGLSDESDERSVFLHRLIRSTEAAGRPAHAQRLRDVFFPRDPDDPDASDASAPESPTPPSTAPPAADSMTPEHPEPPVAPGTAFYANATSSAPSWARPPEPDAAQSHRPENEGTWGGET
ncbi:hypothetical protein [Streptomyces sp. NPDC059816]|uniref:hypothetical protein n=1 Tax=Streptomyces sp. NPDC059816 TaxID=3346960 RepID=UPI003668CAB1